MRTQHSGRPESTAPAAAPQTKTDVSFPRPRGASSGAPYVGDQLSPAGGVGAWRTLAHFARGDSIGGHLANALTVARTVAALGERLSAKDREAIRARAHAVLVLLDDAERD